VGLLVLLPVFIAARPAGATVSIARAYKMECSRCHTIFPQLNAFGRMFLLNNLRVPGRENDVPLATKHFPFALGLKGNLTHDTTGDPETDARFAKFMLHASGLLSRRDAFYADFNVITDNDNADLYVGWLQHAFSSRYHLNLRGGQFEQPLAVSPDIERISVFGYLVYDQPVGMNDYALSAPTRGLMLQGGTSLNGGTRGFVSVGQARRLFRPDGVRSEPKVGNVFARLEREWDCKRVGLFGNYDERELLNGRRFMDHTSLGGVDAEAQLGDWRLYGLWLKSWHTDPVGDGRSGRLDGGFAGVDYHFHPLYLAYARYDWARARSSLGETINQGPTIGVTRIFARTWRVSLEYLRRPNDRNVYVFSIRGAL
jgi:hypothetical protein